VQYYLEEKAGNIDYLGQSSVIRVMRVMLCHGCRVACHTLPGLTRVHAPHTTGWAGRQDSDYSDDVNLVTVKFAWGDDDAEVEHPPRHATPAALGQGPDD
jgi:hypothetical protein